MGNKPPIPNLPRTTRTNTTRTKLKSALRSKRLIGLLVACAAAVVLPITALGTSSAHAAIQPPAAAPSQAQWRNLSTLASSHSATVGVAGDSSPVLSLPAGTSAAQKARLEAGIPAGMKVTVKTSQFAPGQADTIEKAVMSRKWLSNPKQYAIGVDYDAATDKVEVDTDAPASQTASLLRSYPAGKLEVVPARFELQANRFSDEQPFWGGDSVTNGSGICTSGWYLKYDGNKEWTTTAAHCFALGSTIWNSDQTGAKGQAMGTVESVDNTTDVEGITGKQYDKFIWSGGTAASVSDLTVVAHGSTYDGLQLCVSGQTTFNHCGHPISNNNFGYSTGAVNVAPADGFKYDRGGTNAPYYNNGQITEGGDSGAPIYTLFSTNGSADAYGSHSGLVYTYDNNCCETAHMAGSKINSILSSLDASFG